MNIYSIKEIVKATNKFLDPDNNSEIKKKIKVPEGKIPPNTKSIIIEAEKALISETANTKNMSKPLVLKNEIPASNTIEQLNYKINIKPEVKDHIINELYSYLKKKIKKNTLKLIIDQQLEIKNLKNRINFLEQNKVKLENDQQTFKENYSMLLYNNEILKINNDSLQNNLDQVARSKNQLDSENKELKLNLKKLETELKKSVQKNRSFEINSHELKSTISRYIDSYKKLQVEKKQISNSQDLKSNDDVEKIKFYQNENIRLSSELLTALKKNKVIKENLNNIELEKEKISNKIKELSSTIVGKSNVVPSTFVREISNIKKDHSEVEKDHSQAEKDINNQTGGDRKKLDEAINKIFAKI